MILLFTLMACVPETGGRRVTFEAEAAPVAPVEGGRISWTDANTGWTWSLSEATVWVGPIYLWSEEPLLDVDGWTGLHPLLGPTARAEGDHFTAGVLRGEVTEQVRVDLLSGPVTLGVGRGTAGPSRSGELWLEPPVPRGESTVYLVGEASRDELTVPFRLAMSFDDDWLDVAAGENPPTLRRLRGLLWDGELDDGVVVTAEIDVRAMLRDADPSALSVGPEGVAEVRRDDAVGSLFHHRARAIGENGPWRLR